MPFVRCGDEFNDFVDQLGNVEEAKHEKGMTDSIAELESLIQGHRIDNNSPARTKISGPLADRLTKNVDFWRRTEIGDRFANRQNKGSADRFCRTDKKNKSKEKQNDTVKRENEFKNKSRN